MGRLTGVDTQGSETGVRSGVRSDCAMKAVWTTSRFRFGAVASWPTLKDPRPPGAELGQTPGPQPEPEAL